MDFKTVQELYKGQSVYELEPFNITYEIHNHPAGHLKI